MTKHLWEIDHPYYCNEGNYFASNGDLSASHFKSWADFIEENADADFDMNLVFRFDWVEGEDHELAPFNGHLLDVFLGFLKVFEKAHQGCKEKK